MNNHHNHATRDHRFAEIGWGDLSSWAKATTSFKRPEVNGTVRAAFAPVTNLTALRTRIAPVVQHDPSMIIVDSDHGPSKSAVGKAVKECDKIVTLCDARLAAGDFMNRKLGLLK